MKNFLVSTALILLLSAILQLFLPWWIIAAAAFAIAFLVKPNAGYAFLSGFVAIFILWTVYAFFLSHANNNILARKIATLFMLKGHAAILIIITGILGGLVSGFGALSGKWVAELI